MKSVLSNLIKLQQIDTRLDQLVLQKGDLPAMIERVEEDLNEKQQRVADLKTQIEKLMHDRKMFEVEIEASKAQLKKYEDQLFQVKTNKEYDAISTEIETKKIEIEDLENKVMQTLEDEEQFEKEIKELEEEIRQLESQLKEYQKELKEIEQQTREEEQQLLKERHVVEQTIEKRFLKRYNRIREAKGGVAVAAVQRGSCGGCFSVIPPQKIVEIRESNRIYTCEHCGRILVWVED